MNRILFLVKNGIGLGHIRRAILVAEEIYKLDPSINITFISQASTLDMFRNTAFQVINFPLLDRLPSNATERAYTSLLSEVTIQLRPTLAIEDTYPDDRYLSLPALQNIPKILLLRRVDRYGLEDLRRRHYFSLYDHVLLVQEEEDFRAGKYNAECEAIVHLTRKFTFTGPIFSLPKRNEVANVRRPYGIGDVPLVVISAGAGGDHFNDAYCAHLFKAVEQVALRFQESGITAKFLFVVGPYYKGPLPTLLPNIASVVFEPRMPALLHSATVAIIRPGYNTTYEALSGTAKIILVPGISYMEDQYQYVNYLVARHGVSVADFNDVEHLFQLTRSLIQEDSAPHREAPTPQQSRAAAAIIRELESTKKYDQSSIQINKTRIFLLLGNIFPAFCARVLKRFEKLNGKVQFAADSDSHFPKEGIRNLDMLGAASPGIERHDLTSKVVLLQSSSPFAYLPEWLAERGVKVILYTENLYFGISAKDWLDHHPVRGMGLVDCELYHFYVMPDGMKKFNYRVSKIIEQGRKLAVYMDFSLIRDEAELESSIDQLGEWLDSSGVYTLSLEEFIEEVVYSSLM